MLAANGTGTLTHTVPNNEKLELYKFVVRPTGLFNTTGWSISGGHSITNASDNNGIPSPNYEDSTNNNNGLSEFAIPLVLSGGQTMTIQVKDLSGAGNTLQFLFNGVREI